MKRQILKWYSWNWSQPFTLGSRPDLQTRIVKGNFINRAWLFYYNNIIMAHSHKLSSRYHWSHSSLEKNEGLSLFCQQCILMRDIPFIWFKYTKIKHISGIEYYEKWRLDFMRHVGSLVELREWGFTTHLDSENGCQVPCHFFLLPHLPSILIWNLM